MKPSDQTEELFHFNRAQRNFIFNLPSTKNGKAIWGRGTGKSTIIAWLLHQINETMPRSCWVIQGATYQQILTRTLPGTFGALEKLGYQKDTDYFVNRFPPAGYFLPYQSPAKADNCIFLVNHKTKCAVAFTLFSQDRTSSRGPNRDGCICDESLLLDIDKFNAETKPTIRGNREYFGKNNLHHGIFHFTSMPHGESFLFDGNEYYQEDKSEVLTLRDKIADMQLEFIKLKDKAEQIELWSEIHELDKQSLFYAKNKLYYSEYNAFDNIKALGLQYIKDQLIDNTETLFMIEILNKRISKIDGGFYAHLDRNHHGYKGSYNYSHLDNLDFNIEKLSSVNSLHDLDCHPDLPLEIGMDFGTAINWLVVGQEIKSSNQFNFIKNFIVKSPKIIDDLVKDFCDYYAHHKNKTIYLYADAEGNNPRPNVAGQTTYIEQIVKLFRLYKWTVINKSDKRTNPEHHYKYLLWARCLAKENEYKSKYPVIRFNTINCKELLLSMERSPAKDNNNRIGKDKGSERKLKTNREQATDGGDAADQIIYGKYAHLMKDLSTVLQPLF
jgi:hypothetical protein